MIQAFAQNSVAMMLAVRGHSPSLAGSFTIFGSREPAILPTPRLTQDQLSDADLSSNSDRASRVIAAAEMASCVLCLSARRRWHFHSYKESEAKLEFADMRPFAKDDGAVAGQAPKHRDAPPW